MFLASKVSILAMLASATVALFDAQLTADDDVNNKFYGGRSSLARRVNGVDLKATATFAGEAKSLEIRVGWELQYDGPRQPLIILEPSLTRQTSGQTALVCYAEGADGRLYEYERESPMAGALGAPNKDWFVRVEKGKSGRGNVSLPVADLLADLVRNWPEQFPADRPLRVSVQLMHRPSDRAEGYELDPWTGTLYSRVVPVAAAKN